MKLDKISDIQGLVEPLIIGHRGYKARYPENTLLAFEKAVEIKPEWGNVTVAKADASIAWGAVYWQYFEQLDKITPHETPLSMKKELFKEIITERGKVIKPIASGAELNPGDQVIVRIELRSDRAMEYIHIKDMRASSFEPVNVISRNKYHQDNYGLMIDAFF